MIGGFIVYSYISRVAQSMHWGPRPTAIRLKVV